MIYKYAFSFASLYSSIASYVLLNKYFNNFKNKKYIKNIK